MRTIADRAGRYPPVSQLQYALERPNDPALSDVRDLLAGIDSLRDVTNTERAETFWRLVQAEIADIGPRDHSQRRVALRAAFLLGDERQANLGRRLARARESGKFGDPAVIGRDRPRQCWTDGVIDLAHAIDNRMAELVADPGSWARFRRRRHSDSPDPPGVVAALPVPADAQPVFVERHIATYVLRRRVIAHATTERVVRAMEHGVSSYIVRTYDPTNGRHPVRVTPLLNCVAGPVRSVPDGRGGDIIEMPMMFAVPLLYGETTFFASRVDHDEGDEAPMVETQVTSHGIAAGGCTMRVQFEGSYVPASAWWFADVIDARRLDKPPEDSGRRLRPSRLGYLEHTFPDVCRPLAKYGLAWEW